MAVLNFVSSSSNDVSTVNKDVYTSFGYKVDSWSVKFVTLRYWFGRTVLLSVLWCRQVHKTETGRYFTEVAEVLPYFDNLDRAAQTAWRGE